MVLNKYYIERINSGVLLNNQWEFSLYCSFIFLLFSFLVWVEKVLASGLGLERIAFHYFAKAVNVPKISVDQACGLAL